MHFSMRFFPAILQTANCKILPVLIQIICIACNLISLSIINMTWLDFPGSPAFSLVNIALTGLVSFLAAASASGSGFLPFPARAFSSFSLSGPSWNYWFHVHLGKLLKSDLHFGSNPLCSQSRETQAKPEYDRLGESRSFLLSYRAKLSPLN